MNFLAIDSSTKTFSLAVVKDGKVIKHRQTVLKKVLSSSIIPAIDGILKSAKLKLSDLDGFAVGLGPGSFTSLRVGLSTIKGLAFAKNKPIVGIPSLDALAWNVASENPLDVCTLVDARRSLVFGCIYGNENGKMNRKSDYLLAPVEEVLQQVKSKTVFIGDAIALYQDRIKNVFPQAMFTEEKNWAPQARSVAELALERFRLKKFDNIDKLVPLYLYPEDCQVQRS